MPVAYYMLLRILLVVMKIICVEQAIVKVVRFL